VQDDGHILARLDHLIQIADRPFPHGAGQGAIDPFGGTTAQKVASDEVSGRKVVVAGDGVEWAAQPGRHVFHEPRLAAAGRPLQKKGQAVGMGGFKQGNFLCDGAVEGRGAFGGTEPGGTSI